jgi:hypothetical protein
MAVIRREIEIHRGLDETWNRVTDFEKMPAWFYGIKRVTVLSKKLEIGAERVVTFLTRQSFRERIVQWDQNRFFSYIVVNPPIFSKEWSDSISLRPAFDSVILNWEIRYTMRLGILGKMIDGFLVAPIVDKVLLFSLRKFKVFTET